MGLVLASDVGDVAAAMRSLGPVGFLIGIALQLGLSGVLGLAWWTVAPSQPPARIGAFAWASLMAEAAANLLPLTQVGAAVLATRAAVLAGVRPSVALGGNVADVTVEVAAQCLFTVAGLALLGAHFQDGRPLGLLMPLAWTGLALGALLVAGLVGAQRWGLPLLTFVARRLNADDKAQALQQVLARIYARPWRLAAGLGLHLCGWFGAAAATWVMLMLMRRPLPLRDVVAIESLQFAVRNALFIAPLGLGVQEGAYAVLGPLFGLPLQTALAVSLLKRARDVTIGGPVLLSWQFAEARRRLRRRRQARAPDADR